MCKKLLQINVINDSIKKPQCVSCKAILCTETMENSKCKYLLEKAFRAYYKMLGLFKMTKDSLEKLDFTWKIQQKSQVLTQASYKIAPKSCEK